MAINILSIPATSSKPERVFSQAIYTLDRQRSRLKASTIEVIECLKSWFRPGIFTDKDLHTVIAAEQQIEQSEAVDY